MNRRRKALRRIVRREVYRHSVEAVGRLTERMWRAWLRRATPRAGTIRLPGLSASRADLMDRRRVDRDVDVAALAGVRDRLARVRAGAR